MSIELHLVAGFFPPYKLRRKDARFSFWLYEEPSKGLECLVIATGEELRNDRKIIR